MPALELWAVLPAVARRGPWCLAELGAFAEGIALGNEAIRSLRGGRTARLPSWSTLWRTGFLSLRQGDLAHAIPCWNRGSRSARRRQDLRPP